MLDSSLYDGYKIVSRIGYFSQKLYLYGPPLVMLIMHGLLAPTFTMLEVLNHLWYVLYIKIDVEEKNALQNKKYMLKWK